MMTFFYILLPIFAAFMLWLGSIILEKAGIEKKWVFCLLIPFVNIIMVWTFAFIHWPRLKQGVKQEIND